MDVIDTANTNTDTTDSSDRIPGDEIENETQEETQREAKVRKPRAPRKKKVETIVQSISIEPEPSIIPEQTAPLEEARPEKNVQTMQASQTNQSSWAKRVTSWKKAYSTFRPTEKLFFGIFSIIFIFSAFSVVQQINNMYSVELPTQGGTYTEGVVGYARFINPLLGYTDADKDMISLVYSGLLKATPEGKLVSDLAESWTISPDGLTYTFILKSGLTFHDGKALTTDDIEFTIEKAKDPLIKSPRAENWTGVGIEKISDTEITFTLKSPYAPFLENMTLGILPKHIWSNIGHEAFDINTYNREPIGSGPFKLKKAYRDETGIYEKYDLIPFENYSLGMPYIKRLVVQFYKNESEAVLAYKNASIDGLGGISPEEALNIKKTEYNLQSTPLPRVFALFLNQSSAPVLVNKEVREALNASVNRLHIIDTILQGWGTLSKSAIPKSLSLNPELSGASGNIDTASSTSVEYAQMDAQYIEAGKNILINKGWKQNADGIFEKQTKSGKNTSTQTLRFSISTSNVPELKRTVEILKDTWTKMGADVTVEIFEPSDLTQKVIRPRKYDSLLFGNVIGRDLDLYPFWHSSQRNDPGLNIALYTNIKADKALETIRTTSDETKKLEAYRAFEAEIQNDIPAIFLYSPDYIYATSKNIHNLEISNITNPSERFMNIHTWYLETEKVWKIFAQ